MKLLKQATAALLALILVLGMVPIQTRAEEPETTPIETVSMTVVTEETLAPEAAPAETVSMTEATEENVVMETVPAEALPQAIPEETAQAQTAPTAEIVGEGELVLSNGDLGTGTPDSTPPVLHNITLSTDHVTAPGEIEVVMEASDDVSGANGASIYFECPETGKRLYCYVRPTYYDNKTREEVFYEDGKLHGTLEIDQYVESGTFYIDEIYLYDNAGNASGYLRENYEYSYFDGKPCQPLPNGLENLSFTVEESVSDGTPPVLHNITLSTDHVTAPR